MSYYLLERSLVPCGAEDLFKQEGTVYAAVLTSDEWRKERDRFDMGIELEPGEGGIDSTKADVNYDSLTGTFQIPDRNNIQEKDYCFAFALDEKGIVFIDDSGKAQEMVETIRCTKKWRDPSLERFLYDFLELIVEKDLKLMERYEDILDEIEDKVLTSPEQDDLLKANEIRGDVRRLLVPMNRSSTWCRSWRRTKTDFSPRRIFAGYTCL